MTLSFLFETIYLFIDLYRLYLNLFDPSTEFYLMYSTSPRSMHDFYVQLISYFIMLFTCCIVPYTIQTLKTFVHRFFFYISWRFKYRRILSSIGFTCPICLDTSTSLTSPIIQLISCNHQFHQTCLQTWIMSRAICPLCRKSI